MKGLGVLGNSIRGFHLISWRKIFISVILPVLTYGSQVWFRDVSQITLTNMLQVAQNEACRKLAGVFHTTPIDMMHSLLSIPPIRFRLRHLLRTQGHRLASQPPSCLLRRPSYTQKSTLIPSHAPTLPILPPVAETPPMIPVFSFPNHPATPPWSHPHVTFHKRSKNNAPTLSLLKKLTGTTIFLASAPFHTPKVYLHIFAIYDDTSLLITDYCLASSPMHSLLLAATSSLKRVGDRPERREISFFYSDAGLPTLTSDPPKNRNVTLINSFHNSVLDTLTNNPLLHITGRWFSKRWADARTAEWLQPGVELAFQATLTRPQHTITPLSDRLEEEWRSTWTAPLPGDPRRNFTPLGEPPSLTIPDFVRGALTADSRSYQSAAFQLITGHAFEGAYSTRFCRGANDTITCPHCGEFYTTDHVLFECDHFWYECATTIHCDKNYLFSTLSGGKMLVKFLHLMQSLLRPLPGRTDPPDRPAAEDRHH